jgi:hypothetical protein
LHGFRANDVQMKAGRQSLPNMKGRDDERMAKGDDSISFER